MMQHTHQDRRLLPIMFGRRGRSAEGLGQLGLDGAFQLWLVMFSGLFWNHKQRLELKHCHLLTAHQYHISAYTCMQQGRATKLRIAGEGEAVVPKSTPSDGS